MGDGQLLIRPMEERDIAQAARIEAESFSTPWSAEAFRKSLALDYTIFLTAEWEGRVAGYCGCYVSLEEAEITNVAVKEELRGRGIARALLLELLRQGGSPRRESLPSGGAGRQCACDPPLRRPGL